MSKAQRKLEIPISNFINQKITKKAEILREEMDEEVLLFNPKTRETYVLNQMAHVIWELCDGMRSPEEITDEIVSVLDVNPNIVFNDVLKVLKEFIHQNLVDVN